MSQINRFESHPRDVKAGNATGVVNGQVTHYITHLLPSRRQMSQVRGRCGRQRTTLLRREMSHVLCSTSFVVSLEKTTPVVQTGKQNS